MVEDSPLLILGQSCEAAIDWVVRQISKNGLQVVRTFDLQVARHDHIDCPCPHHGTEQCDCQMVVLLVYASKGHKLYDRQPVSIVAHGYNGQTWFAIIDSPQQRADPEVEAAIRLAFGPFVSATLLDQSSPTQVA